MRRVLSASANTIKLFCEHFKSRLVSESQTTTFVTNDSQQKALLAIAAVLF